MKNESYLVELNGFKPSINPLYEVNFDTGKVFSKRSQKVLKGEQTAKGYIQYTLNGCRVYGHRWVFEQYHHVKLQSTDQIDHIDRNQKNNSIRNLRLVNCAENNWNKFKRADSQQPFKGVSRTASGKYSASIVQNGLRKYLGSFPMLN
jgi:phage anti-repressor protein